MSTQTMNAPPPPLQEESAAFAMLGIAHEQAGIEVRERFSLSAEAQQALLAELKGAGADGALVIQTCNRTEVLAIGLPPERIGESLLRHCTGSAGEFQRLGHVHHGVEAMQRLFRIAAGLDAQILGDLQIIKQVRDAYERTRAEGAAGGRLHRLMQHVNRAHKRIRNETRLGNGAASISHAAVQFVLREAGPLHQRNLLLVGTGKIGKVTARNLAEYGPRQLTLINRSPGRAERVAKHLNVRAAGFEDLPQEIAAADVIIVASGAQTPVVLPEHVVCPAAGRKILLDLSIPRNIHPAIGERANIRLADLDDLQSASDEAYQERLESVAPAETIIRHELDTYQRWLAQQRFGPTIRRLQERLERLSAQEADLLRGKLDPEAAEQAEEMGRRLTRKFAAHVIEYIRSHPDDAEALEPLVEEMFKLRDSEDSPA